MKEIAFVNVSELLAALHAEETAPPRFAVQFILVSGLQAWHDLLTALRAECTLFRLSEHCGEEDLFPYLGDLRTQLGCTPGDRILLLPLAELLHLAPNQVPLHELATWAPSKPKRVYVPVLERRDLLTDELAYVGRYLAGECVLWSLSGAGEIDVHAVPFPIEAGGRRVVRGLSAYLELWEQGGADSVCLISRWASGWTQAARLGRFHFHVSPNGHSALSALVPQAQTLSPTWGEEDDWRWLAFQAHPEESLEHLVGEILNVMQANVKVLLEAWPRYTSRARWLAWVWARSLPPSGCFADMVVRKSSSWQSLLETTANAVFEGVLSLQHLAERRRLLGLLDGEELPPSFWSAFEAQTDPILRLQALPGFTTRQKEQIVLEVAKLLQCEVSEDSWIPILCLTFPALAAYLTAFPYRDVFVRDYLRVYTRSRLVDSPLPELLEYSAPWERDKALWAYPTRAYVLAQQSLPEAQRLWVDALGIEWAGLLHTLLNDDHLECTLQFGRAELPTSTSFNREWSTDELVERELDNQAHALGYAFPRSLVREIMFIEDLAEQIRVRCQNARQVLISADHGLTRFAACTDPVEVPDGWIAHKWGRYASPPASGSCEMLSSDEWLTYNNCLILARHALFRGGARIGGEVHGGATLEEALVPILVVHRRQKAHPTASLLNERIRSDREGVVRLTIALNEPIQELRLTLGGRIVDAERAQDNRWLILLRDIPAGVYQGLLQYEGGLLAEVRFEILQRGIIQDEMGLPDKR